LKVNKTKNLRLYVTTYKMEMHEKSFFKTKINLLADED